MLVLTRRQTESLLTNIGMKIQVLEIRGNQVRLGIDAPDHIKIWRDELKLWNNNNEKESSCQEKEEDL